MIEKRLSPTVIEDTLRPLVGRDVELTEGVLRTRGPLKRFAVTGNPEVNQSLYLYVDWIAIRWAGKNAEWEMHLQPQNEEQQEEGFELCMTTTDWLSFHKTPEDPVEIVSFSIPYIGDVVVYQEQESLTAKGKIQL